MTTHSNYSSAFQSCEDADKQKINNSLASQIEAFQWQQGIVLPAEDFFRIFKKDPLEYSTIAAGGEADFFVLASQTCDIVNPKFHIRHSVEWIAAQSFPPGQSKIFANRSAEGRHPVIFQCSAAIRENQKINIKNIVGLNLCLFDKIFTKRELLGQEMPPSTYQLLSTPLADFNYQDAFAHWISRSYTRPAFPNSFNDLFERAKINKAIEAIVKSGPEKILGIFYLIDQGDPDTAVDPVKTSQMLMNLQPPYCVSIVFLYEDDNSPVKEQEQLFLNKFKEKISIKNPESADVSSSSPIEYLKSHFIFLTVSFLEAQNWGVSEYMRSFRYNQFDFLSSSHEAGHDF